MKPPKAIPLPDAAKTLLDAGADIVGMNCLRPPEHTLAAMEQMRKAVSGYLACQPVAYRTPKDKPDFTSLPEFPYALDPLQLTRKEMGDYALRAREIGINYIGSCCGSVAIHVREMARALGKLSEDGRVWKKGGEKPMSAYEYYGHDDGGSQQALNPQKPRKKASHPAGQAFGRDATSSRCDRYNSRSRDRPLERASSGCPFSSSQSRAHPPQLSRLFHGIVIFLLSPVTLKGSCSRSARRAV